MSDRIDSSSKPLDTDILRTEETQAKKALDQSSVQQQASERQMTQWAEEGFNPVAMSRRFQTLEDQKVKKREKITEDDSRLGKIEETKDADQLADKFNERNPELFKKTLLILRERLSKQDTSEDILRKVLEVYPDFTLADEALDYLLQTSVGNLNANIRRAREALNAYYKREIIAGRNISAQAKEFSEKGLGTQTGLRDMYRDITGTPRTPHDLFDELSQKFGFDKLNKVIDFLLHSLGSDLKAKGPSISRAELKKLIDDARALQAILGVYTFFQSRINLMRNLFDKHELPMPPTLNYETLAKRFMALLKERYISPERVFQQARFLGISDQIVPQIIAYTQMRDAIRGVATRLYRNDQHRQEVLQALIETLEELDDQLEEEEEE